MIRPFKFWCYKVLPLVYDDSLSYYEVLCKVVKYINEILEELEATEKSVDSLREELKRLKEYVDHYFDNLDVQEEINNKLDEMAESGELDEILGAWLYRTPFAEVCDTELYGQMTVPSSYVGDGTYAQAFTIFKHTDNKYYCAMTRTGGHLQIEELEYSTNDRLDGTNDDNHNYSISALGHGNGMTYCDKDGLLYVACGGDEESTAQIVGIDPLTLTIEKTYNSDWDVQLQKCAAIAWNSEREVFYVYERGMLLEFDSDMHFLRAASGKLAIVKDYVSRGQSIFTDGKYIYQVYNLGNGSASDVDFHDVNCMIIYHCSDLSFYRKQMIMLDGEIEGGCYFNGNYYLMKLTNRVGQIYSAYPYNDNRVGNYTYRNGTRAFTLTNQSNLHGNELWCDCDYYGFRVDGNETYPYGNLYAMIEDCQFRSKGEKLWLHIAGQALSDFNVKDFESIKVSGYTSVSGNDAAVKGLYVSNGDEFEISDVTVNALWGETYAIVSNVCKFRFDRCTFDGSADATSLVQVEYSSGVFADCHFGDCFTEYTVNAFRSGAIYFSGDNTSFDGDKKFYVDSDVFFNNIAFDYQLVGMHNAYGVYFITSPTDFDMSKVRRQGCYKIAGSGATFVNVPSAITENFGFTVTNFTSTDKGNTDSNNICMYEVVTESGVYYKAILVNTTLTWYDITGTVGGTFTVER